MNFITEFMIEIVMIYGTAYENYDVYIIMDFSALVVINYIDRYYYFTIMDDLKSQIEEVEYKMPLRHSNTDVRYLNKTNRVMYVLTLATHWFYEMIYFHFWPYIGLIFSFQVISEYERKLNMESDS